MQKRIGKVFLTSIISVACFALPVMSHAQSKSGDSPGGSTAAPDTQTKRGATVDKAGANKKDPSSDRKPESPPGSNDAEPAPKK
jgi:hypothetical protein